MSGKQVIQVPGDPSSWIEDDWTLFPGCAYGWLVVRSRAARVLDPSTGEAVGPTFDVQARQAFKNLDTVLQAGRSRLNLVVNTTVLVADASSIAELNRLFSEFFSSNPPARMVMTVPLPK